MTEFLLSQRWSPYLVGAGIGVLSWLAFLLCDKPLACSTSFARTAGMLERLLGGKPSHREYFRKFKPEVDWQWLLVAGIFIGAFAGSITSGGFELRMVPQMWEDLFGSSIVLRYSLAFAGGILIGFGARWAGGCTSGHGISGALQLTLSSWLALLVFFGSGILFSLLLHGGF